MDELKMEVLETHEEMRIVFKIPRSIMFQISASQAQMFSSAVTSNKSVEEKLRIIFIVLLEIFSRGDSNGKN